MIMNYFTFNELLSALDNVSNYSILKLNDESQVIISEYGGRPLGLFPDITSYSLLWINPDLEETILNRKRDIGGDRYWVSPERLFFYKKPETWEEWFCPEKLDPAYFEIKNNSKTSCTLESAIEVKNQMTDKIYRGKIIRSIDLIEDPLDSRLDYCGVHYHDRCILDKPNLKINGWSLTNIISGGPKNPGSVLIPTKEKAKPISYFRNIPKERLIIDENYVGFKIDVNDIYKLGIRPEDLDFSRKAKIGYVLDIPDSENLGLLLKLSNDIPKTQDECFDIARDHPEADIGVIQSYNSESPNKSKLRYGEIELQLNLFETKNNKSIGDAEHQLLAYIGTKNEIFEIIKQHLGIINPRLF